MSLNKYVPSTFTTTTHHANDEYKGIVGKITRGGYTKYVKLVGICAKSINTTKFNDSQMGLSIFGRNGGYNILFGQTSEVVNNNLRFYKFDIPDGLNLMVKINL